MLSSSYVMRLVRSLPDLRRMKFPSSPMMIMMPMMSRKLRLAITTHMVTPHNDANAKTLSMTLTHQTAGINVASDIKGRLSTIRLNVEK